MAINKMYETMHVEEDEADDAIDAAGYTGNFRRSMPSNMTEITEQEFFKVFKDNDKLGELSFIIRNIDKDHNGYVTSTEMDDILKVLYPKQLANVNLKHILRPHCSSANKVLLDYKNFKAYIKNGITDGDPQEPRIHSLQNYLNNKVLLNPTQKRLEHLKESKVKNAETKDRLKKQFKEINDEVKHIEKKEADKKENERVYGPPPEEEYNNNPLVSERDEGRKS